MPQVNPLPDPFIRVGDTITADLLCRLAEAATRNTLLPGGFQNGRLNLQHPQRNPVTDSTASQDDILGILIKDVPAAELKYKARSMLSVSGTYTKEAVIPLAQDEYGSGVDEFLAEMLDASGSESESQHKYDAINAWQLFMPILAGIEAGGSEGSSEDARPVLVRGYITTWGVPREDEYSENDAEVFVIKNVYYPVCIVKGVTTTAVAGGDFEITGVVLRWGIPPIADPLAVTNPDGWDSDDGAYCLAMMTPDGTWVAIDLACPSGSET